MSKRVIIACFCTVGLFSCCTSEKTTQLAIPPLESTGLVMESSEYFLEIHKKCQHHADCKAPLVCSKNICSIPPSVTNDVQSDTPTLKIQTSEGKEIRFYLEVVREERERALGLMLRRKMHPEWGMLFVFDSEAPRSFWMQNCFMSLDMVFIRKDGSISNISANAMPGRSELRYRSTDRVQYVLELPAGTTAKHGITADSKVIF